MSHAAKQKKKENKTKTRNTNEKHSGPYQPFVRQVLCVFSLFCFFSSFFSLDQKLAVTTSKSSDLFVSYSRPFPLTGPFLSGL
jgi:hypothetical protein